MPDVTVLVIALGPVQDFIQRARRTRDLWFGSHLLSELSKASAAALVKDGWELVFPALKIGDPGLKPADGRLLPNGNIPLAVVNRVVAKGGEHPEESARQARSAAISRWKQLAGAAHQRGHALLRDDVTPSDLETAIEDVLEFYAAWGCGPYDQVRRDLDAEIAARKTLREFPPWQGSDLPKSSLDGFRETVLRRRSERQDKDAQKAARIGRLGDSEQLDAIGFVKRFGGDPEQFPSVARVTVQAWIEALLSEPNPDVQSDWNAITKACSSGGIGRLNAKAVSWSNGFPFDGEVFFRSRWPALAEESSFETAALEQLLKKVREPSAYVACLAADGDGMGAALSEITRPEEHQAFSAKLASFAAGVRALVESHGGALIFAGGDDVLALAPVANAPDLAEKLAREFRQVFGLQWLVGSGPTLSVGIGIGHFLTPLGELLALARRAETLAKGHDLAPDLTRNAIAVVLSKRGGADIEWREKWTEEPVESLRHIVKQIAENRLPTGFAYELGDDVLRRLPKERPLPAPFDQILRDEIVRTWRRKLEAMKRAPTDPIPEFDAGNATAASLEHWIAKVTIAKHLSEHQQILAEVRRLASIGERVG